MKYHIEIHGCQMNYSDAERVATVCERNEYEPTDDWRQADLVIYLSCSVKQKAEDKIIGHMKELHQLKKSNPNLMVAISGCMVRKTSTRKDNDPDRLLKILPTLDFVFRIEDLDQLENFIRDKNLVDMNRVYGDPTYIAVNPKLTFPAKGFIPIMTGCDNYCSYCVVPYARGRERSRLISEIVNDARKLVKQGVKEILLLGQNVNSFGNKNNVYDLEFANDGIHLPFIKLLMELNRVEGISRIRFTSPHPKDVTEELISTMSELEKVCEHIHLPLQSGDNQVLKNMNRNYTAEHFLSLVKLIRKYMPRAGITTDIIVGFCGETDEQFQNTIRVCERARFDLSYTSMYSERPETYAAKNLPDNISKAEKTKRYHAVNDLIRRFSLVANMKYVGETWEVLVDKIEDGLASGKTRTNRSIRFPICDTMGLGDLVNVEITKAREWVMEGRKVGKVGTLQPNT